MSTTETNGATAIQVVTRTAVKSMATRFEMSQENLIHTLRSTILQNASDAEFAAFLVVSNQYQLNPFTKEIHAFSAGNKGIVPMVGVDGWAKIVNRQDAYDGCEFEVHEDAKGALGSITCRMYVKGRGHATEVTEYLAECKRNTPPWTQMPRRMLRHKAFMQAARIAFGIAGLYDEDEARDIVQRHDGAAAPAQSLNDVMQCEVVDPFPSDGVPTIQVEQPEKPTASEPMVWQTFCERMDHVGREQGVDVEKMDALLSKLKLEIGGKGAKFDQLRADRLDAFADQALDLDTGQPLVAVEVTT